MREGRAALIARALVASGLVFALVACAGAPPGGGAPGPAPVIKIVFPVAADSVHFASGWQDDRENGRKHNGQDIFCPRWTPVLAVTDGTVDWLLSSPPKAPKGYRLLLRGDDGNVYYYDHLNNDDPGTRDNSAPPRYAYARGLKNGDRVAAGDIIGYVGDSGNAEQWGPHLHFEIHLGKWGSPIDPLPSLRGALARRAQH